MPENPPAIASVDEPAAGAAGPARHAPALAAASLAVGAAGVALGCFGPGGAWGAGTEPLMVGAGAGGGAVLAAAGAWLLRRGRAGELVGGAVADLAAGDTAPELLRITRTDAFPAADWNRLLDQIAANGLGHAHAAAGAAGSGVDAAAAAAAATRGVRDFGPALDAVPHGVLLLGHDARVEHANAAAARLLRTPRPALLNQEVGSLLDDEGLIGRAASVAAGLERRGGSLEVAAGEDGASTLRATLRPLRGPRPAGAGAAGGRAPTWVRCSCSRT